MLKYFTRTRRVQPDITRKVMEAIDHFGWKEVCRWSYQVRDFQLDEELLPWALEQIHRTDGGAPSSNLRHHLAHMVSSAPIQVLRSQADRILADEFFHRQLSPRIDDTTPAATVEQRLEIHALSAETCWNELLAHCEAVASVESFRDANIPKCEIYMERIVEDREFSQSRQQDIRDLLANTTSRPNDASEWLVGLLVMLAGKLQLTDTIAHLYGHYEVDWDWYNEEITQALIQIGTAEVHRYVAERYGEAPWYVRNYAHTVFENVYSESVLSHVSSLLEQEQEGFLRGCLGVAAASHFDERGVEVARSVFLEDPDDPERQAIVERLVAHAYLSELDLPERAQWERQIHEDWKGFQQRQKTLSSRLSRIQPLTSSATATRVLPIAANRIDQSHPKVGRNSLCPCGSGKKYKKCCLRKSTL